MVVVNIVLFGKGSNTFVNVECSTIDGMQRMMGQTFCAKLHLLLKMQLLAAQLVSLRGGGVIAYFFVIWQI